MARKSATTAAAESTTETSTNSSPASAPPASAIKRSTTTAPPPELPSQLADILASQIPESTLNTLLELRTTARNPQKPKVTHLSDSAVSITFDQPVRQYWFHPIPQIAHITIQDLPANLPPSSSPTPTTSAKPPAATPAQKKWADSVASAISAAALNLHATKIDRYIPPTTPIELMGVFVFLAFTFTIIAWIFGVRGPLEQYIFKTEGRFNLAVIVHAVVLVKRSGDAKRVGELMKVHWDQEKGGAGARWAWTLSAWIEGWRTVGRVLKEVERVEAQKGLVGKKQK